VSQKVRKKYVPFNIMFSKHKIIIGYSISSCSHLLNELLMMKIWQIYRLWGCDKLIRIGGAKQSHCFSFFLLFICQLSPTACFAVNKAQPQLIFNRTALPRPSCLVNLYYIIYWRQKLYQKIVFFVNLWHISGDFRCFYGLNTHPGALVILFMGKASNSEHFLVLKCKNPSNRSKGRDILLFIQKKMTLP